MTFQIRARTVLTRSAAAVLRRDAPSRRGSCIVACTNYGSLGDEAMILGAAGRLKEMGRERVSLLVPTPTDEWPEHEHVDEIVHVNARSPRSYLRGLRYLAGMEEVWVVGADTIDGCYTIGNSARLILMADYAARCGGRGTIMGCSVREKPHPLAMSLISSMHPDARVCIRDPVSHERAERKTGRSCALVADVAFLLRPRSTTDETKAVCEWIEGRRHAGDMVLGVNFNHLVVAKGDPSGEPERELIASYIEASARLMRERSVSVVLVPHDHRQDHPRARAIYQALRGEHPERVCLLEGHARAPDAKQVASLCDGVLSGRMHFAIAALGTETPVASITYQDKFQGLYQHFGISGLYIDPVHARAADRLHELLVELLETAPEVRRSIAEALPRVKSLSLANFEAAA